MRATWYAGHLAGLIRPGRAWLVTLLIVVGFVTDNRVSAERFSVQ